jgi:hypothetical protein
MMSAPPPGNGHTALCGAELSEPEEYRYGPLNKAEQSR